MNKYFSDQLQELQEAAEGSELVFRRDALEVFRAYGMPQRKQDPWKYVNNSALFQLVCVESKVDKEEFEKLLIPEGQSIPFFDFVFYNDQFFLAAYPVMDETEVEEEELEGWQVCELDLDSKLDDSAQEWQLDRESLEAEENSYSLINALSFTKAYQVQYGGQIAGRKTTIRLSFRGRSSYQAPRFYIEIPAAAEVEILLDTGELGADLYWNPYFFFDVGEGARLTLLERGPSLASASGHLRSVTLRAKVASNAYVNAASFYWGTSLAVQDARFAICGENANVQLRSLCFGEGNSAYHMRCENQHLAPNSESQCLYKNVLFDKASSEFYGIIHADNKAVATNAEQQNRNLLLSEDARAIARPQLEILIDDLQCRHGSSVGSIDPEELFYMRSRGLKQNEAMRLAIVGFVEEISTYFADELLAVLGIEDCLKALLDKREA